MLKNRINKGQFKIDVRRNSLIKYGNQHNRVQCSHVSSRVLIGFPTPYQSFTSFLIGLFRSTSGYINQLGFRFVLFLTYYSVECQTKSLSNLCVRFAMLPIFLAISNVSIGQAFLRSLCVFWFDSHGLCTLAVHACFPEFQLPLEENTSRVERSDFSGANLSRWAQVSGQRKVYFHSHCYKVILSFILALVLLQHLFNSSYSRF